MQRIKKDCSGGASTVASDCGLSTAASEYEAIDDRGEVASSVSEESELRIVCSPLDDSALYGGRPESVTASIGIDAEYEGLHDQTQ